MWRLLHATLVVAFVTVTFAAQLPSCQLDAIVSSPASVSSTVSTPVTLMLKSSGDNADACTVANVAAQEWTLRFSAFRLALTVNTQRSTTSSFVFNPVNVPAMLNVSMLNPETKTYEMSAQLLMNGGEVIRNNALFRYFQQVLLRDATVVLADNKASARVSLAANAFPVIPNASSGMKLRMLLESEGAPVDIPLSRPQRISAQRMEAMLLQTGIDTFLEHRDDVISLLVMFTVDGNSYQSFAVAQPRSLFSSLKPAPSTTTLAPSSTSTSSTRDTTDYVLPLIPLLLALVIVAIAAVCAKRRVVLPPTTHDTTTTRTNPMFRPSVRGASNDLYEVDDQRQQPTYSEPEDMAASSLQGVSNPGYAITAPAPSTNLHGVSNPGYAITAQPGELYEEVEQSGMPTIDFGNELYEEVGTEDRHGADALPPVPAEEEYGTVEMMGSGAVYGNVGESATVTETGALTYGNNNYGNNESLYGNGEQDDDAQHQDENRGYLEVEDDPDDEFNGDGVVDEPVYGDDVGALDPGPVYGKVQAEDIYGNGELETSVSQGYDAPLPLPAAPVPAVSGTYHRLSHDQAGSEPTKAAAQTNHKRLALIIIGLGLLATIIWYAIVFSSSPTTSREAPPAASQAAPQAALSTQPKVPGILLGPLTSATANDYTMDMTVTVGDTSLSQAWTQTFWFAGSSAVQHHWLSWTQGVTSSWTGQAQWDSAFYNATQLNRLFQNNLLGEPVTSVSQSITNAWLLDLEQKAPTLSSACRTPTAASIVFDHSRVPASVDKLSPVADGDLWVYTWGSSDMRTLQDVLPGLTDDALSQVNGTAQVERVVRYNNNLQRIESSMISVTITPDTPATSEPQRNDDANATTSTAAPTASLPVLKLASTMTFAATNTVDEQKKATAITEIDRPGLRCVAVPDNQRHALSLFHRDLPEAQVNTRSRRSVLPLTKIDATATWPEVSLMASAARRSLDTDIADGADALFRFSVADLIDDLKDQVGEAFYNRHRNYQYDNTLLEVIELPDARFTVHFGFLNTPTVTVQLAPPLSYDLTVKGQLKTDIRHERIVAQGCLFACWSVVSDVVLQATADSTETARVGVNLANGVFEGQSNSTSSQALFVDGDVDLADLALVGCDELMGQLSSYMQAKGMNASGLECRQSSLEQGALAILTSSPEFSQVYGALATRLAAVLNDAVQLPHAVADNVVQRIDKVLDASFTASFAHVDVAVNMSAASALGVVPENTNSQAVVPVSLSNIGSVDALLVYRSGVISQACALLLTRTNSEALLFNPQPGVTPFLTSVNVNDPYTRITLTDVTTMVKTGSFEITTTLMMSAYTLKEDAAADSLPLFTLSGRFRFFGTADLDSSRYLQFRVTTASLLTTDLDDLVVNGGWTANQSLVFDDARALASELLFVWSNEQLQRVLVLNAPSLRQVEVELNEGFALFRSDFLSTPSAPQVSRASELSSDSATRLSCGTDNAITAWYAENMDMAPPKDLQCQPLLDVVMHHHAAQRKPLAVESAGIAKPTLTAACKTFSTDLWLLSGGSTSADSTWLAECPLNMILTSVNVEPTLYQRGVSAFECCELSNAAVDYTSCATLSSLTMDGVTANSADWNNQCASGAVIVGLHSPAHFHSVDAIKCCGLQLYQPSPSCPRDTEGNVCGGFGFCQDDNTCRCRQGYYGESCQLVCPGGVDNVCSGHGVCQTDGKCSCEANYLGPSCSVADCNPSCVNGVCENQGPAGALAQHRGSPFIDFEYSVSLGCTCEEGWSSVDCSVPVDCALNCPLLMIANGVCNPECMTTSCNMDGGDCDADQSCPCDASFLRDGICHPLCNVPACSGEAEDCTACGDCSTADQANDAACAQACVPKLADLDTCLGAAFASNGVCNVEFNTSACAFDGGDCLTVEAETCASDCNAAMIGDGNCDLECFTVECAFDLDDCKPTTTVAPTTTAPSTSASLNNASTASQSSVSPGSSTTASSQSSTAASCEASGCNPQDIGNGVCDASCNIAECQFDGNDCFDCNTISTKCGSDAQGHCSDSGKCLCFDGFSGLTCSSCNPAQACSGKGACQLTSRGVFTGCDCNANWLGVDCSSFNVSACVNGLGSVAEQRCICNPGWSGPLCDLCVDSSLACNDRGFCLSDPTDTTPAPSNTSTPDQRGCNCYTGWEGSECESCSSSNCNFHGDCNDDQTCTCTPPYLGEACDECSPSFCNFRGNCTVPLNGTGDATCECGLGWAGDRCERCDTHFEGDDCATCELGYYLDMANRRCVKCRDCPVGSGASVACVGTTNTECSPCEDGKTFSDLNDFAQQCTACNPCAKGFGLTATCLATSDTQCRRCTLEVDFSDVSDLTSTCKACAHCEVGFGIDENCAEDRDTICERCDDGSYSNHTKYEPCKQCPTTCTAGEELLGECTAAVSSLCTLCKSGFYKTGAGPQACSACRTSCPAGQQLQGACTATTTPSCVTCPAGQYKTASMTRCRAKRTCNAGERMTSSGSASSDRVCSACPSGQYQTATQHTQTSCLPCRSSCPSNQYRTGSCGGSRNYGCSSCRTSCPSGQIISGLCSRSGFSNYGCSTCRSGAYKSSQTSCSTCSSCSCYSRSCSSSLNAVCRSCPPPPRRCFAANTAVQVCSATPHSAPIQSLTVGDRVRCVRRTNISTSAELEVSCCAVTGWLHVEHDEAPGFTHLHYTIDGQPRKLSASHRHIAYVYRGEATVTLHAKIQFSPKHFHTVLFEDVRVGDQLGIYRGDDKMLQLVTVESVEAGPAVGAYVVLLEDGGSPIVEDALMSMSSMVKLPGPVDETAYGVGVDLDIVMTSFLAPFIATWNGTGSLLDDVGGFVSATHTNNFKIHRDVFQHPGLLWSNLVKNSTSQEGLESSTEAVVRHLWQAGISRSPIALDDYVDPARLLK
eukprot:m.277868 g.277868  ORF g.277868 m.277868 type:complete len:2891 (+) comp17714_c0_seq2:39-8711(+)